MHEVNIELGDYVEDDVSRFSGYVTGITHYLGREDALIQVQPRELYNGVPVASQWFDAGRLQHAEAPKTKATGYANGR